MIKEIAFTAYYVTDLSRAVAFYEDVLELKTSHYMDVWAEFEIGAGAFALTTYGTPSSQGANIAFEMTDLDATLAKFRAKGVTLVPFEVDGQVVAPDILDTPVCRMFMAKDPDGNVFILHQRKEGHL